MQELDLGDEIQVKVKYKGKEYVLREPSVAELTDLRNVDDNSIDVVGFVTKLGLPADVVKNMGMSKLRALVDGIMDLVAKKK